MVAPVHVGPDLCSCGFEQLGEGGLNDARDRHQALQLVNCRSRQSIELPDGCRRPALEQPHEVNAPHPYGRWQFVDDFDVHHPSVLGVFPRAISVRPGLPGV
jgi:hypothetical protein